MTNIEVPELTAQRIDVPEGDIEAILAAHEATAAEPRPKLTAEQKTALYEEAKLLDVKKTEIEERISQIREFFRSEDYGTQTVHKASGGAVTIGRNPIFQADKFKEAYPFDATEVQDVIKEDSLGRKRVVQVPVLVNAHLYKVEPNRPVIKKELGELAEEFYTEGEKKVTIK